MESATPLLALLGTIVDLVAVAAAVFLIALVVRFLITAARADWEKDQPAESLRRPE